MRASWRMARSCPTTRRRSSLSKSCASGHCLVGSRTVVPPLCWAFQSGPDCNLHAREDALPTVEVEGQSAMGNVAILLVMVFLRVYEQCVTFSLSAGYTERSRHANFHPEIGEK